MVSVVFCVLRRVLVAFLCFGVRLSSGFVLVSVVVLCCDDASTVL